MNSYRAHAQSYQPVVWYSWLAACMFRGDGAIQRSFGHPWTSNKAQKQATTEAAWETFTSLKC